MASHYEALDLPHSASDPEIRSAYRRRALATHPDKGGSAEAFRSVVEAFETLIDPLLRKSYDAELLSADVRKGAKVAKGGRRAEGAKGGPKEPKMEKKRKCEDEASDWKRSGEPEDHMEVFRRIMKLPCKKIRAEVRKLTEETLRQLSHFLESLNKEHQDEQLPPLEVNCPQNPAPLALNHVPHKEPSCAPRKASDVVRKGVRASRRTAPKRAPNLVKGVAHWVQKSGSTSYQATVCLNCLFVTCQSTKDLNAAIDMHVSLVQMRQYVLASLNDGKGFREALESAVQAMHTERCAVDAEPMRLCYQAHFRRKWSKRSKDLDDTMQSWDSFMKERQESNLSRNAKLAEQPMLELQRRREEAERKRQEQSVSHNL